MHILGTTFIFVLAIKVCLGFYLQTSEVQAFVGDSVILSCNGSGYSGEELHVHWEAMGKDVISLKGDNITFGRGFEDRVNFLQDPAESEDFSLVLSDVMLNDGEIYECLWKGTKPICSVTLQVLTPAVLKNHEVFEGDSVTLDCFGNIPKNKPWEDIYIQWLKDDREILRLSSGEITRSDYSILRLPQDKDIRRGIFSLSIPSVSVFDRGVYQCRYKSTDYEAPRSGSPQTHTLLVWALFLTTDTSVTDTHTHSVTTETSVTETGTDSLTTNISVPETGTDSAVSPEVWSSSRALSHTQTSSSVKVWTQTESSSSVPTLTYAERDGALLLVTDTSVSEADTDSVTTDISVPETGNDSGQQDALKFLSDEIPWIRIGLISGVLLVTAIVLGLLLVFGRI